jgi:hypothetical protein
MYPPARGWGDVSDAMRRTSIGASDRLFYYYTQTENMQHFEQRGASVYTMLKLAESIVAARIHQEIIAHARLSYCYQGFPPDL